MTIGVQDGDFLSAIIPILAFLKGESPTTYQQAYTRLGMVITDLNATEIDKAF